MNHYKEFRHPLHKLNAYRALMKKALREQRSPSSRCFHHCSLEPAMNYYFIVEYSPDEETNSLKYGLCCFDADGCILFNWSGNYPVSLWRFRRQGANRTSLIFRGLVLQAFQRFDIVLNQNKPFADAGNNVFQININNYLN